MKTKLAIIATLITSFTFATAAEKFKAPNKGRIITSVEPHAEFLVTADKKVEIRFLDEAGKVIAPAAQTASIVMGERSAPTKLAFTKDGDKLVSDKAVPEGKSLPVVLTITVTPDAKSVTEKFNLNMASCPPCGNPEYACACEGEAHDH
jgi:selenocysteine-specific translation elongation factor